MSKNIIRPRVPYYHHAKFDMETSASLCICKSCIHKTGARFELGCDISMRPYTDYDYDESGACKVMTCDHWDFYFQHIKDRDVSWSNEW